MKTPAADFAELGADLLRLTAGYARSTQGKFDGDAAVVLSITAGFLRAAVNGFSALVGNGTLTDDQRQRCSILATTFRDALGNIASHFPSGGTITSIADLGVYDPTDPTADRLGALLAGDSTVISMTAPASSALGMLKQDPLNIATLGRDGILSLMGDVAWGTTVVAP